MILSGTTITEQIIIDAIDLSQITISSEDAFVPVDSSGWTGQTHDTRDDVPFIFGDNGAGLPTIGTVFRLVSGDQNAVGYCANKNSIGLVLPASGFEGFYDNVIANNGASICIREGVARNAGRWGVHARHGGEINAKGADLSNCYKAASADRGGDLDIKEAILSNSVVAIECDNASRANANKAIVANCGEKKNYIVVSKSGSVINCTEMAIDNCTQYLFQVKRGGTIVAFDLSLPEGSDLKSLANIDLNSANSSGIIYGNP